MPIERRAELCDLIFGPPPVHPVGTARGTEVLRDRKRPALAHSEPLIELAKGGDAAGPGGDGETGFGHPPGESQEVLRRRLFQASLDVLGKVLEVPDIGETRIEPVVGPLKVGPPLEEEGMG